MKVTLSNEQNEIVQNAKGHFLVRACPGSGKTYTLAAKVAFDAERWQRRHQGIAVVSFTNIAQLKISDDVRAMSGKDIDYPHFVGTIDSFINHYIFFPYIYLLGFNPEEVKMIGEPFESSAGWFMKRRCALALIYTDDGELVLPPKAAYELSAVLLGGIAQKEKDIYEKSRFTQSDAVYYALKILELFPEVVDIVAARFPWVYVDEAQDTTPTHWKILKLIAESKENERFGVVGDPDQSIYAWNGAKPELFVQHQKDLESIGNDKVFHLLESWRSSQVICDFYVAFSSLPRVPTAVDMNVASLGVKPIIEGYVNSKDILEAVRAFPSVRTSEDESYAVICQSHDFICEILASDSQAVELVGKNPIAGKDSKMYNLMHAKYDFEHGNYQSALLRAENIAFNLLWEFDREKVLSSKEMTIKQWFTLIEEELEKLPSCDLTVEEWSEQAGKVLPSSTLFIKLKCEPKRKANGINYRSCIVSDFFTSAYAEEAERFIETVHAVKGKTYDHVLVILGKDQSKRLLKGVSGVPVNDTEDKRKLYVAITRARKSVTLYVTDDVCEKVKEKV